MDSKRSTSILTLALYVWFIAAFAYQRSIELIIYGNGTSAGLYHSYYFVLLFIILIIPFLFFLTFKSSSFSMFIFIIFFASILYYQNDFASQKIFFHTPPSIMRLIIIASVSGVLIRWTRGIEQKFNKIDFYLIVYGIAAIILISSLNNSFWLSFFIGKHWFYALNSLFHGSLSFGSSQNYYFQDAIPFRGEWYLAYGYGSVIFPLFFGAQIKFGSIISAISAVYLYLRLYKLSVPTEPRRLTIAIILSMIFLSAVLFSGTMYPYTNLGASIFLATALIYYFSFKKNRNNKKIILAGIFFVVATFFRVESILALMPILAYEMYTDRNLKNIVILSSALMMAAILYFLQNYIKFGNPFQAGHGYSTNINDPNFKPLSIKHLQFTINWFFIDMPRIVSTQYLGFLRFPRNGSELGGSLTIKYIGLFIGLGIYVFSFLKRRLRSSSSSVNFYFTPTQTPMPINFICLSSGICILILHLLGFNISPRFDMMYAPILIVSGFYFLPRSNVLNYSLLIFLIWVHIANLLNIKNIDIPGHEWLGTML